MDRDEEINDAKAKVTIRIVQYTFNWNATALKPYSDVRYFDRRQADAKRR